MHNIVLLREGIQLRAYGQKDPLQEYKREAFNMFNQLLRSIQAESIQQIFRAQPQSVDDDDLDILTFENLPEGMTPEDLINIIKQVQEAQGINPDGENGFISIEDLEALLGAQGVNDLLSGEEVEGQVDGQSVEDETSNGAESTEANTETASEPEAVSESKDDDEQKKEK